MWYQHRPIHVEQSGRRSLSQSNMTAFYRYSMTYRLPRAEVTTTQAVTVPEGAEVLLAFPLPNLSARHRRALMVRP